jgi:hypothetical protein
MWDTPQRGCQRPLSDGRETRIPRPALAQFAESLLPDDMDWTTLEAHAAPQEPLWQLN